MMNLYMSILESADNGEITESVANDLYFTVLEATDIKDRIKILKSFNIKTPMESDLMTLCRQLEECKKETKNYINDEKTFPKIYKISTFLIGILNSTITMRGITKTLPDLLMKDMSAKEKIIKFIITLLIEAISMIILIIRRKKIAYDAILQCIKLIEEIDKIIPKVKDKNEKDRLNSIKNTLNDLVIGFASQNTKGNELNIYVDSDNAKSFKESVADIKLRIYEENVSGNISDEERDLLLEMISNENQ